MTAAKKTEGKAVYKVDAALVSARTDDGRIHYFYAGEELPEGIVAEDVKRLADDGLISVDSDMIPVLGVPPVVETAGKG